MEKFITIERPLYNNGEYAELFSDGACRGNGKRSSISGAGAVLFDQNQEVIKEIRKYLGDGLTNNIAEYKALILGLKEAVKLGIKIISVHVDSKLVCEQVRGNYKIRKPHLLTLCDQVKILVKQFDKFKIDYIPRAQNTYADRLANESINFLDK